MGGVEMYINDEIAIYQNRCLWFRGHFNGFQVPRLLPP